MGQLWRVTAIKSEGQVSSGISVGIHKTFGIIGSSNSEIRKAITEKYSLTVPPSNIKSIFKVDKL